MTAPTFEWDPQKATAKRAPVGIAVLLLCSCAHAPGQRVSPGVDEQLIAKAVWWATRVPEAAREYQVRTPAGVHANQILRAAANDAKLVMAGRGVLRQPSADDSSPVVYLTFDAPQWVTEAEVVIPFTYALGQSKATACAVRIRLPEPEPNSWIYRGEGERCWPRPSPRP